MTTEHGAVSTQKDMGEPTGEQKAQRTLHLPAPITTDGVTSYDSSVQVRTTDVAVYEVLGAVNRTKVALHLLTNHVHSAYEARRQLKLKNREEFINNDVDHTNMIQSALLEYRIPSDKFCRFAIKYGDYMNMAPSVTLERYLGAAKASSYPDFNLVNGLVEAVLQGRVKFDDLMQVTPSVTSATKFIGSSIVIELFEKCADPSIDYDASDVTLNFIGTSGNLSADIFTDIYLEYGIEVVKGMREPIDARDTIEFCDEDNLSKDQTTEALKYMNSFERTVDRKQGPDDRISYDTQDVYSLYRAGVPNEFAVDKMLNNTEVTINQVIAMHEGLSSAVSSGWL